MLRTVVTEQLGIQYPIVCGGMTATGSAELAAGVSNAGALGMLTCLHCRTPEGLNSEIARCHAMTSKPFGVNLTILGEKRGEPEYPEDFAKVRPTPPTVRPRSFPRACNQYWAVRLVHR
jgi:nitronate monooxygenase